MKEDAFLRVDRQPISLGQALEYLQTSGKLGSFVGEILRQYVLERELETRREQEVDSTTVEQSINNFLQKNQLLEPEKFEQWLTDEGIDYETFCQQIVEGIRFQKLIAEVTEPKLQEYFIDKKLFWDRVVLSRLVVEGKELAEELKCQVLEEGAKFEQLVQEYSLTGDRVVNGMMGTLSRGKLPDVLRSAIDSANPGDLVGPIEIQERWCLLRLEKVLPASLADEKLKKALQEEIFEDWLAEQIQKMRIQMEFAW